MKRTNVILDEQLLKDAVELTGEKTYSAAINRALGDMVRKAKLKKGLEWFAQLEDPWWPGYPEEMLDEDALRRYHENQAKRRAAKTSIIADAPIAPTKKPVARKRRGTRR